MADQSDLAIAAFHDFANLGGNAHNFKAGVDWQDLKSTKSIVQNFADRFAQNPQQTNYDLYVWDGSKYVFDSATRLGAGNNALNVGLNASYVDEFTIGAQQQFGPTLGAGVRYIHRTWNDMIDDIFTLGPNGVALTFENASNADRDFNGLEFTFEKRFSNHWNLLANYTYGKVRGNHFGGNGDGNITSGLNNFSDSICRTAVDTTIGTNGSIPCSALDTGLEGRPTWDVPHIVNMLGSYVFSLGPVNLTTGASGNFASGASFSKTRTMNVLNAAGANSGQTRLYFYDNQGSDRAPNFYQVNTSLEATYRLFNVDLGAKFEIFNITDRQAPLAVSNTAWSNADTAAGQATRDAFGTFTARGSFQAPRAFRITWLARF